MWRTLRHILSDTPSVLFELNLSAFKCGVGSIQIPPFPVILYPYLSCSMTYLANAEI